jgi:2-dehydro-3-deoxygluconokinase
MSKGRLVTLGETLGVVASIRPGPVLAGSEARLSMAGSESNVAIGVSRLGGAATWIGHVGDDPFGRLIERELRAEGVDARVIHSPLPTALLLREQRTDGFARITYHRTASAGSCLSPDDIPDDILDGADVLHVTGITPALGAGPAAAVDRMVTLARQREVLVSVDVNYRANLWSEPVAATALRPLLARADVVFAGEHEAALFTERADPSTMARALHEAGAGVAVIKLGARGSWLHGNGLDVGHDALDVGVVDTVGAGDAFVAGYLAELMAGGDPADCLVTATAMGAFAVSTRGDWEGLPRRDELGLLASVEDSLR